MRFERAQRLPFRIFLLVKPGGLWLVCPVEGGKGNARERRENNENAVIYI